MSSLSRAHALWSLQLVKDGWHNFTHGNSKASSAGTVLPDPQTLQNGEQTNEGVKVDSDNLSELPPMAHKRPLEPPKSREVVLQQIQSLGNEVICIDIDTTGSVEGTRKRRLSSNEKPEYLAHSTITDRNINEPHEGQDLHSNINDQSLFDTRKSHSPPTKVRLLSPTSDEPTSQEGLTQSSPASSSGIGSWIKDGFSSLDNGESSSLSGNTTNHGTGPFEDSSGSSDEFEFSDSSTNHTNGGTHQISTGTGPFLSKVLTTTDVRNKFEDSERHRMRALRERNLKQHGYPPTGTSQKAIAAVSEDSSTSCDLESKRCHSDIQVDRDLLSNKGDNDAEREALISSVEEADQMKSPVQASANSNNSTMSTLFALPLPSSPALAQFPSTCEQQHEMTPILETIIPKKSNSFLTLRTPQPDLRWQDLTNRENDLALQIQQSAQEDALHQSRPASSTFNDNEAIHEYESTSQQSPIKQHKPSPLDILADRLKRSTRTDAHASPIIDTLPSSRSSLNKSQFKPSLSKLVANPLQSKLYADSKGVNWYPSQGVHLQLPKTFERLSADAQRTIREHETVKERKRDLEALDNACDAIAQFGTTSTFDKKQKEDIREVGEFAEKVLVNGLSGHKRRTFIAAIKDKFSKKLKNSGRDYDETLAVELRRDLWDPSMAEQIKEQLIQLYIEIRKGADARNVKRREQEHISRHRRRARFRADPVINAVTPETSFSSTSSISPPAERSQSRKKKKKHNDLSDLNASDRQRVLYERRADQEIAKFKEKLGLYDEKWQTKHSNAREVDGQHYSQGETSEEDEGEEYNRAAGFLSGINVSVPRLVVLEKENESTDFTQPERLIDHQVNEMGKADQIPDHVNRRRNGAQQVHKQLLENQPRNGVGKDVHLSEEPFFDDADSDHPSECEYVEEIDRQCHRYLVKAMYKGFDEYDEETEHVLGKYYSLHLANEVLSSDIQGTKDLYSSKFEEDVDRNFNITKSCVDGLQETKLQFGENEQVQARIWIEKELITINNKLFRQPRYRKLCQVSPWYFVKWKRTTTKARSVQQADTQQKDDTDQQPQQQQAQPQSLDDNDNNEIEPTDGLFTSSPPPLPPPPATMKTTPQENSSYELENTTTESDPRNDEEERSFTTITHANKHAGDLLISWLEQHLGATEYDNSLRELKEQIQHEVETTQPTVMYSKVLDFTFPEDDIERTEMIDVVVYKRQASGPAN